MNFQDLHESVRAELQRRVEAGLITATSLARQSGFQQAHISNFLNRRRALSLEGLDRVLAAQNLSVDQLMPVDIAGSAEPVREATHPVPVVSASTAMEEAEVRPAAVIETLYVPAATLAESRARPSGRRAHWQRFVAIRANAQQAAAMEPVLLPGSVVMLDRHYNSVAPYRGQQRTLFAVRSGAGLALRYVELDGGSLVLRPLSVEYPVQVIAVRRAESAADYVVGRVVLALNEL